MQQKGGKANTKNTAPPPQPAEEPLAVAEGKSFAKTTIWGQNIINCRPFSLESPKKFSFLGSFTSSKAAPVYPSPEVAFIGRSNVGKSSLLNTLTGGNKKIAVESKTPGRTQCINMFKCEDREGDIAVLVDLPGYGYAKISKTQQEQISGFLQEYMKERSSLRLVFVLVDIRREPQDLDRAMIDFLEEEGVEYVVCATKVDKMASKTELTNALAVLRKAYKLPAGQPIAFSSVTGEGRKEIWRNMRDGILGESLEREEEEAEEAEEVEEEKEVHDPLAEIIESERKPITVDARTRILRKK
jgi:GTP-binding protein